MGAELVNGAAAGGTAPTASRQKFNFLQSPHIYIHAIKF